MTVKRFLTVPILALSVAFLAAEAGAQSLQRDDGPAEIPPSSFTANQYVDSKGCVYIRAGIDGNTSWVPRVNRSRKVVCGATPSLGAAASAVAAAAPARAAPAPVQIGAANTAAPKSPPRTVAAPAARTASNPVRNTVASILSPNPVRTVASTPARSAPQVQRVNIPQPSGVAAPQRRTTQVRQPKPQVVRRAQPQTVQVQPRIVQVAPRVLTQTAPRRVTATTQTCNGASALSNRYNGDRGLPRRCGPQPGPIYTTKRQVNGGTFRSATGQALNAASINPNAIVVPRHVYEQQQAAANLGPTPKGYREAWTDGRLNTKRTYQTLGGKAQMDLVWSQTVPRRLIATNTGRDVTRSFPGLRYPYTSMAQQNGALSQGVAVRSAVVSTRSAAVAAQPQQRVVRKATAAPARVSTRTSVPRQPAAAAGKRFVQVGTFGVPSNAQRAAARLQNMGLPVRIGKYVRGGKEMRIVLAGPFASSAHTGGALTALRNAGYRDAFARN